MAEKRVKIIEAMSELGAGRRGAGLGVSALKAADAEKDNKIFSRFSPKAVKNHNDKLSFPAEHPYAKKVNFIAESLQNVAEQVEHELSDYNFPLVFSGDHSNAAGTIAGIKNFYADKRLGVIWIDAHADLHTPYTTPSGNIHGMPLAASLGYNNLEDQENEPVATTIEYWESIKKLGSKKLMPKIKPEDLVFIGIRDLEQPEWDLIKREKIKYFEPEDIKRIGINAIANETLKYLSDCDIIYVSFDVDSMDPTVSRGTGTPVPNGLTLAEAKFLLTRFYKLDNLVTLEITEINPLLDDENKMAKAVLSILYDLL